jgi:hypothetical protein
MEPKIKEFYQSDYAPSGLILHCHCAGFQPPLAEIAPSGMKAKSGDVLH